MKRFQDDPFGPENLYNGTCVDVSGDVLVYTGNEGQVVANKLSSGGDAFEKIKSCSVIGEEERLKFTRIFSVSAGRGDNFGLVGARYKYGATFFNLEEGSEGLPILNKFYSLPAAKEAVEMIFLPDMKSGVLDSSGRLSIVDLSVCSILSRDKVSVDVARWRWGVIKPAYHPRTLLVGDRLNVGVEDLRTKCGDFVQIFSSVDSEELVRGLDSNPPYTYILTDGNLILSDVRNRKRPVDSWQTALPGKTQGSGLTRERIGDRDWVCIWNRWGDTSMMVLEWGHSGCEEWKEDMEVSCRGVGERRPDTVGMPSRLAGWRDAVRRGRGLGGSWLDEGVEARARVVFTGACLVPTERGVAVVGVNAAGDLTETRLGFGEEPFGINDDEEGEIREVQEAWMEEWAKEVVNRTRLTRFDVTHVFDREKRTPIKDKIEKMPRKRTKVQKEKEKKGKGLPFVNPGHELELNSAENINNKNRKNSAVTLARKKLPKNYLKKTYKVRKSRQANIASNTIKYCNALKKAAVKLNLSSVYRKRRKEEKENTPRSYFHYGDSNFATSLQNVRENHPPEFLNRCILQILEEETPSGDSGKDQLRLSQDQEASLPGEEDPDYTMRAFMEDLGAHSTTQF